MTLKSRRAMLLSLIAMLMPACAVDIREMIVPTMVGDKTWSIDSHHLISHSGGGGFMHISIDQFPSAETEKDNIEVSIASSYPEIALDPKQVTLVVNGTVMQPVKVVELSVLREGRAVDVVLPMDEKILIQHEKGKRGTTGRAFVFYYGSIVDWSKATLKIDGLSKDDASLSLPPIGFKQEQQFWARCNTPKGDKALFC